METRRIVVVVEEVEVAKTALQWALHNLLRYGDQIILLHVFTSTRSRNNKKQRVLRLKGFQLALSFKDLCDQIPDAKVEIVVREGDQEGRTIASMITEIGASDLVLGLHDQSFLYRMAMSNASIRDSLHCRVLAIKQPTMISPYSAPSLDFTLIEIARLSVPPVPPQKIPYQILPSPFSIMWRSKRRRKRCC
ncbi:Adenine nucleotide alpha hydrolases-like superfamily protein [Thalictrum thalictroides]|uniref:Adenine nucleotide alpha hydrolases-like superfamily protein n=1 Tax=Thalictrum thalictroides TaxID=46969 RepID=A0A7J6X6R2_THATH|nr:Adenine nucleotide alpha hydrolases-like superfamily protein [Thalictrum thalictroides]